MIPVLTQQDLEEPRLPDDLFTWVREIRARFGATKAGRSAFRLHEDRLVKALHDELWPVASYAHLFYSGREDVLFQSVVGSQAFDAQILDGRSMETVASIEVTTALDDGAGYQERLRALHLDMYGHAPATGVRLTRDPNTGHIPRMLADVVNHDEAREFELDQIERAVSRKSRNRYGVGTILLIEFRSLHFTSLRDQHALDQAVKRLFRRCEPGLAELALVGDCGAVGARFIGARWTAVQVASNEPI